MASRTTPTDPLFGTAWHLHNTGQSGGGVGMDLNVVPVWPTYTGKGVRVAVIDTGFQLDHPDLVANVDVANSYDATTGRMGGGAGNPVLASDNHGTTVAGIIGAKGNNGLGSAGVAYDATLVSYRIALGAEAANTSIVQTSDQAARAFEQQLVAGIDVSSNSWGSAQAFAHNWLDADNAAEKAAVEALGTLGRGGLGTSIVFAAGNDREARPDVQLDNMLNNHFVITVAALNDDGVAAGYSSPGSSLFVSAFGGGWPSQRPDVPGNAITTTDRTGTDGENRAAGPAGDYAFNMNGTSAATPMVSGVIALMLEANPELGYRDVKDILAYSARWNDAAATSWTFNHAKGANGGGLHYSRDYGFGLIDAHAAVRLAEVWGEASGAARTEANLLRETATAAAGNPAAGTVIRAGNAISVHFDENTNLIANHVELDLDLGSINPSLLYIQLISPGGTYFNLLDRPGNALSHGVGPDGTPTVGAFEWDDVFTLGTPAFLGESVQGRWTLQILQTGPVGAESTFNGAALRFLGDAPAQPRQYVFTDDFARLAASDESRLSDYGDPIRVSRLNAAAVTEDVAFDLTGATASRIGGQEIVLTGGARFDRVFGGDGDDRLIGDGRVELFSGGAGADFIDGGAAAGRSATALYGARMEYSIGAGADGGLAVRNLADAGDRDQLVNIGRLQFEEGTLYAPAATDIGLTAAVFYTALLGREADGGGYRHWTTMARDLDTLERGFLDSAEYRANGALLDDTSFVDGLYTRMLGRAGEAAGVSFWAEVLAGGVGREDVVLGFMRSEEFVVARTGQLFADIERIGDVWAA